MIRVLSKQTRKYFSDKAKKQCRDKYGRFAKSSKCELGTCGKTCVSSKCETKEKKVSNKWIYAISFFALFLILAVIVCMVIL